MARRISLSRAARLVGVKRGTLQQQIRAGELQTFEGEILLTDLLQAYPNAQVEDSSMLERVEQIIEQASFINTDHQQRRPDNQALTARVMSLSEELARLQRQVGRHRQFVEDLRARLATGPAELRDWADAAAARLDDDVTIDQSFANETFLRVMSAQATVIPSGHEFFVEGAESILEAGLRGGLALNYGCSNGNCGLCKIRLVSGEVRRIKHHDYSLTEAEKGLGYLLSCSNTAVSDIVLEADEASGVEDIPRQNIPIRIKKIDRPNDAVLIVSTKTPRTSRLRFLAGQGASLSVEHVGTGFYPIASCPCDDMNLQFHIAVDPGDAVAGFLQESAKTNDLLTLEGPEGSFVLNENSPNPLIFIAEGIGFASIKGLIEHAMALDVAEKILLLRVSDNEEAPYLHNLCRAWNDALDNFEYLSLTRDAADSIDSHLQVHLDDANPADFDYYLATGREMRQQLLHFFKQNAVPTTQFTWEGTGAGAEP